MEEQATATRNTKQRKRPVEGLLAASPSDSPPAVLALIERVVLDPTPTPKSSTA